MEWLNGEQSGRGKRIIIIVVVVLVGGGGGGGGGGLEEDINICNKWSIFI